MKRLAKALYFASLFFMAYFVCLSTTVVHASKAGSEKWSFDFENCTISEAMQKMSEASGINVSVTQNINRKISKSYKDKEIDQILKDIFRNVNCAMVWYYDQNGLNSAKVWIFEGGGTGISSDSRKVLRQEKGKLGIGARTNVEQSSKVRERRGRESNKSNRNNSLSAQMKSKNYEKKGKEMTSSRYGNLTRGAGFSRMSRVEKHPTAVANRGEGGSENRTPRTDLPPSPPKMPHGLEPPPMPPGFSYAK